MITTTTWRVLAVGTCLTPRTAAALEFEFGELGLTVNPTGSTLHAFLAAQEGVKVARGDLCVLVEAGAGVQIGCALYRI